MVVRIVPMPGVPGPRGAAGQTGAQGPTGATGAKGDPGFVYLGDYTSGNGYIADVAVVKGSDNNLYVAKQSGGLGDPTTNTAQWDIFLPKGIAGVNGADGDRYATTSNSSLTIGESGTVTLYTNDLNLDYSVAQSIIISHSLDHHMHGHVFSYNKETGQLVVELADGSEGSGTFSAWYVNLDGAVGIQGDIGPQGPQGTAATITVGTTVTGNPGTSASVTNSGTVNDAIFNFTIPRGKDLTPRGNWSSSTTYAIGDAVYHASSNASYVATQAGSNRTPSSSSSYWTIIAQDGADGTNGAKGDTGATGATGPAGPTNLTFITAPSSPTSAGTRGQVAQSSTYLYICIATNSWKRIAFDSWNTNN